MSEYKKHYLSKKHNNKYCPLKGVGCICDSHCAWFDHEEQDCRKILALEEIGYKLKNLNREQNKDWNPIHDD